MPPKDAPKMSARRWRRTERSQAGAECIMWSSTFDPSARWAAEEYRAMGGASFTRLLGGCGLLWPNVPWRHPLQDSVPHDQRVKQDRTKVSEERQEKEVGEDGVRLP